MPRNAEDFNVFRDTILTEFLANNTVSKFFKNIKLLYKYCELRKLDFDLVRDYNDPLHRKTINYLQCLRNTIMRNTSVNVLDTDIPIKADIKIQTKPFLEKDKDLIIPVSVKLRNTITTKQKIKKIVDRKKTKEKGEKVYQVKEIKEIKEIKFNSEYSKKVHDSLNQTSITLLQLREDLTYFLNGGTELMTETEDENGNIVERERFLLEPLSEIKEIIKILSVKGSLRNGRTISSEAMKELKERIRTIKEAMMVVLELQEKLADIGFMGQREMQGAILNDKAMVENGIIRVEDAPKEITDIPKSIIDLYAKYETQD